jgi:hypothetical protein
MGAHQHWRETGPVTDRTMKSVFGFEVDQTTEMDLLKDQLDQAGDVICEQLVEPDVACQIYDAQVTTDGEHSCLGCNLNEAVHQLGYFLEADLTPASQLTRIQLALGLVNVLWERLSDVCSTLEFPESLWKANEEKFKTFKKARCWTNFMKHPGFFGLGIHHPLYVVEGGGADEARMADGKQRRGGQEWVLIDTQFVRDHWQNGDGEKLGQKLKEPFTACVVLPDMSEMVPSLCEEFTGFVDRMGEPTWVELASRHVLTEMPCDWS